MHRDQLDYRLLSEQYALIKEDSPDTMDQVINKRIDSASNKVMNIVDQLQNIYNTYFEFHKPDDNQLKEFMQDVFTAIKDLDDTELALLNRFFSETIAPIIDPLAAMNMHNVIEYRINQLHVPSSSVQNTSDSKSETIAANLISIYMQFGNKSPSEPGVVESITAKIEEAIKGADDDTVDQAAELFLMSLKEAERESGKKASAGLITFIITTIASISGATPISSEKPSIPAPKPTADRHLDDEIWRMYNLMKDGIHVFGLTEKNFAKSVIVKAAEPLTREAVEKALGRFLEKAKKEPKENYEAIAFIHTTLLWISKYRKD